MKYIYCFINLRSSLELCQAYFCNKTFFEHQTKGTNSLMFKVSLTSCNFSQFGEVLFYAIFRIFYVEGVRNVNHSLHYRIGLVFQIKDF